MSRHSERLTEAVTVLSELLHSPAISYSTAIQVTRALALLKEEELREEAGETAQGHAA